MVNPTRFRRACAGVLSSIPSIAYSTRIRKSPYFENTERHGCKAYTVYNRMLMPILYDYDREYESLTENVAIWDVASQRQVEISGRNAEDLVQYLTCRHIRDMKVGECRYSIMCDSEGSVINDPVLLKLSPERFWFSIADQDILLWVNAWKTALNYDDIVVREPDVSPLAVQGPSSKKLICDLFPHDTRANKIKKFQFIETHVNGIPVLLARSGWSPEDGYELYLEDYRQGEYLWEAVWDAGKKYGIFPGAPNQTRRIESGMISFGADTLANTNALELGLPNKFVDLKQSDDFLGKRALNEIVQNGGPQNVLVPLILKDNDMDAHLCSSPYFKGKRLCIMCTTSESVVVGTLTSISPQRSKRYGSFYVGMGLVDVKEATPGNIMILKLEDGSLCQIQVLTTPPS